MEQTKKGGEKGDKRVFRHCMHACTYLEIVWDELELWQLLVIASLMLFLIIIPKFTYEITEEGSLQLRHISYPIEHQVMLASTLLHTYLAT